MTKKPAWLTFQAFALAFALFLLILWVMQRTGKPALKARNIDTLDYIFASNSRAVSMNPLASDSLVNLAHMEHLVGTLIKQGASGRYEPYLASKWWSNERKDSWTFQLRSDLVCENGETISAEGFKTAFERNLRTYANGPLPVFKDLENFDDFLSKRKPLSGIAVEGNNLTFKFTKKIKSGILEFLAMPYYGYYCAGNYGPDGGWKDDLKIISSGSYSLHSVSPDRHSVTLKKRADWFSISEESPGTVSVSQMPLQDAFAVPSKSKIIFAYHEPGVEIPQPLAEVKSIPEILVAIVLSPQKQGLFSNEGNRRLFYQRLRAAQKDVEFPDKVNELSDYFYPYAKSPLTPAAAPEKFILHGEKELKLIASDHLHDTHREYLKRILNSVFKDTGLTVNFERIDKNDPNWMTKYRSNMFYDIRVAGVSIGGSFDNWVIEMMFCSKLGVSFPDPSGRICKLVKDFDSNDMSIENYAVQFNNILHEDMAVIPLFHRRYSWLISPDVDGALSPVSGAPRFDLIRAKGR